MSLRRLRRTRRGSPCSLNASAEPARPAARRWARTAPAACDPCGGGGGARRGRPWTSCGPGTRASCGGDVGSVGRFSSSGPRFAKTRLGQDLARRWGRLGSAALMGGMDSSAPDSSEKKGYRGLCPPSTTRWSGAPARPDSPSFGSAGAVAGGARVAVLFSAVIVLLSPAGRPPHLLRCAPSEDHAIVPPPSGASLQASHMRFSMLRAICPWCKRISGFPQLWMGV